MRIGIDARELGGRATGVGRYLAGLIRAWATTSDAHEYVLYSALPISVPLDPARFHQRIVAHPPNTWWEQVRLPGAAGDDRLDVFFAPAYTVPLRLRVPIVVTIHDVSYAAHPEWFRTREGIRRRWLTRKSAARARAIVTVSEFSRREIVEHLAIEADRVHVIPQGIDVPDAGPPDRREPRVLYAGSVFNRRHVPDLIRAIGMIAANRADVSLDIAGDDRTFPAEDLDGLIAELGLSGRVRWHRYVSDGELRRLYLKARAFAFLSEYEGLGMTPLEALGAGIPPVVADTPVARETCRDAAIYVPVGDVAAAAGAITTALFDDETRGRILGAGPATLGRYDWSRAARETLKVLEHAAGSPASRQK